MFKNFFGGSSSSTPPAKKPEETAAGSSARPPVSVGSSASGGVRRPATGANPGAPPARGGGGGANSMFSGLEFKLQPSAPPAPAAATSGPLAPRPPPAASAVMATAPTPIADGGFDIFSGLKVLAPSATAPPAASKASPRTDLSGNHAAPPARKSSVDSSSAHQESSFSFLNGGDSALEPGAGGDAAPEGSAFDFLMESEGPGSSAATSTTAAASPGTGAAAPRLSTGGLDFGGLTIKQSVRPSATASGSPRAVDPEDVLSIASERSASTALSAAANASSAAGRKLDLSSVPPIPDLEDENPDAANAVERGVLEREGVIQQKLQAAKSSLERALIAHWQNLKSLHTQQEARRAEEKECQASLSQAEEQLRAAEAQQTAAVEAEQYDKADELNEAIDRLKRRIGGIATSAKQVAQKLNDIEDQKLAAVQRVVNAVNECTEHFAQIQQLQEEQLEKHVSLQTSRLNEKEDKLNANFDRIERVLNHVASDLDHVQQEEREIEDAIRTQTADVEHERETLVAEEKRVQAELDELVRLMRLKEEELRAVRKSLDVAESKIASARTKHERKLKRIQEKKDRILSDQSQAKNEEAQLQAQRVDLETLAQNMADKTKFYNRMVKTIKIDVKLTSTLVERLKTESEKQRQWAELERKQSQSLHDCHAQIAKAEKDTEVIAKRLQEIEQELTTEQQAVASADVAIPRLEAEKKLAVTAKNYKKASQASSDIKNLQTSRDASVAKITDLNTQVDRLTDEQKELRALRDNLQREQAQAQTTADLQRAKLLTERLYFKQALLDVCQAQAFPPASPAASSGAGPAAPGGPSTLVASPVTATLTNAQAAEADMLRLEIQSIENALSEIRARNGWAADYPSVARPDPFPSATVISAQVEKETKELTGYEIRSRDQRAADKAKDASTDSDGAAQPAGALDAVVTPSSPVSTLNQVPVAVSAALTSPSTVPVSDTPLPDAPVGVQSPAPAATMMSAAAAQPQVATPVDLVALRQRWSDACAREVELKAQEEQAVALEDYEAADRMNGELTELHTQIAALQTELEAAGVILTEDAAAAPSPVVLSEAAPASVVSAAAHEISVEDSVSQSVESAPFEASVPAAEPSVAAADAVAVNLDAPVDEGTAFDFIADAGPPAVADSIIAPEQPVDEAVHAVVEDRSDALQPEEQ